MGYLKPQETDLLYLPSDPEHRYWVRMRKRAPWGVRVNSQGAMLKVSARPGAGNGGATPGVVNEAEWSGYIYSLMLGFITEWNLTGEDDRPLPITIETLQLLEDIDGEYLSDEAQARQEASKRSPEREAPLGKPLRRQSSTNRR